MRPGKWGDCGHLVGMLSEAQEDGFPHPPQCTLWARLVLDSAVNEMPRDRCPGGRGH